MTSNEHLKGHGWYTRPMKRKHWQELWDLCRRAGMDTRVSPDDCATFYNARCLAGHYMGETTLSKKIKKTGGQHMRGHGPKTR